MQAAMSQAMMCPLPPFNSKEDFLAHGIIEVANLDQPLDCSICREPLFHLPKTDNTPVPQVAITSSGSNSSGNNTTTLEPSHDVLVPESPIRIHPCNHIFGATSIMTWFTNSSSNRCPECNTTLFSKQRIYLALRTPTRDTHIQFANHVEFVLEDAETAALIRQNLMSDWTSVLMTGYVVETWRAEGWEVMGGYVDEDEDEGLFGEEEERVEADGEHESEVQVSDDELE
jgi:hypothetical protein